MSLEWSKIWFNFKEKGKIISSALKLSKTSLKVGCHKQNKETLKISDGKDFTDKISVSFFQITK